MDRREFLKTTTLLAEILSMGVLPKKNELIIIHRWDGKKFIRVRMDTLIPGDIFTIENSDVLYKAEHHPFPQHNLALSDGSPIVGIHAIQL